MRKYFDRMVLGNALLLDEKWNKMAAWTPWINGLLSHSKSAQYIFLSLTLPFLAWLLLATTARPKPDLSDVGGKINLAMRRTADGVLRASGDSTSRIPAVEQSGAGIWRVRLNQRFVYDSLPSILEASLKQYGIVQPYNVFLRRCDDESIVDLGYNYLDFTEIQNLPCRGRELPEGSHYLEVQLLPLMDKTTSWPVKSGFFALFLTGIFGFILLRFRRPEKKDTVQERSHYLHFGASRLDFSGQRLLCASEWQDLTFREAKLLYLFVQHPNQVLERDFILQQVWADEGVMVGRSIDVFVSRLRKKLAADETVNIVAVHGVGYRMEIV